jgi:RNA-directed DNA polymerase
MIVVRYADDAVLGFEHRNEAEAFLEQLQERMRKFGLELHSEKTRLIEFGRFAEDNRKRRGEGKPETFDFLGIHAYLREDPEGQLVYGKTADGQETAAEQTASGTTGAAQAVA